MDEKEIERCRRNLEADIRGHLASFTMITGIKISSVEIKRENPLIGRNDYKVRVNLKL